VISDSGIGKSAVGQRVHKAWCRREALFASAVDQYKATSRMPRWRKTFRA